ncbi:MAG: MMPL family transporter [Chloroflexota bacterium]|nr:MMPL family transporter [Chloroflexota bacterium]
MLLGLGCTMYRHRRLVLVVWGLALLLALPVVPRVFRALTAGGFSSPDLEAFRASQLLAIRFGSNPSSLFLVYEDPSGSLQATDPRFQDAVEASLVDVRQLPYVESVVTAARNPRQIAPDGRAQYATLALTAAADNVSEVVPGIERALRPTQSSSLQVTLTGAPVFYQDIFDVTERDLRRAELLSIPAAAIALVLVFGSIVAGAVPGLVGGTAVAITLALMVLLSQIFELSIFSLNLASMLGLGLGIDYSLFVVSRFREESALGASVERAVAVSIATAGRAVLFSGATVMIGLLALLTFDITALRSMGIAGALVVGISILAALTLLPALLGVLGSRIDALMVGSLMASVFKRRDSRSPRAGVGALGVRQAEGGLWTRLAGFVMGRPVLVLVPLLALLIGLGAPFLRVEFGAPDASILPTDVQSRRGFDLLRAHWGEGELSPLLLVFQTTDGSGPLQAEHVRDLANFMRRVQADPNVARAESVVNLDPRITPDQYALIYADPSRIPDAYGQAAARATVRQDTLVANVISRFGQTDKRSKDLVRAIRAAPPPAGLQLLVGGGSAGVIDYADRLYEQFPRAAIIIVLAIYLVLLRTFGSVVIPIKAVAMNALSILASYGALVVIFQEGALAEVLHFQPLGFVEASLPIVMFCVLFGLSMDYEVFLLSRIQEAHLAGANNATSVARGLERSGRIITSAAAIVVLVSLSFVAADIVLIKALGLGTAIAVLLDATLVRALLVPATMRLLGEWNWWSPGWLRRFVSSASPHASD